MKQATGIPSPRVLDGGAVATLEDLRDNLMWAGDMATRARRRLGGAKGREVPPDVAEAALQATTKAAGLLTQVCEMLARAAGQDAPAKRDVAPDAAASPPGDAK